MIPSSELLHVRGNNHVLLWTRIDVVLNRVPSSQAL